MGAGLAVSTVVEVGRLYLALVGNLSEQLAALSTFWFATLLVQQPLVIVTLIVALSAPGEILVVCAMSVMSVFIAIELLVSFTALRNVARHRDLWQHYQAAYKTT